MCSVSRPLPIGWIKVSKKPLYPAQAGAQIEPLSDGELARPKPRPPQPLWINLDLAGKSGRKTVWE